MLTYKHINQDNLTSELQKLMSLVAEHDKWFKDQDQKLEEQEQKLKEQWNYLIQHDYQGICLFYLKDKMKSAVLKIN
jgi:hypothetical protein